MKSIGRSNRSLACSVLLVVLFTLAACEVQADSIFTVRQSYTVEGISNQTGRVRGWFWMPEDRPEQSVLEFRVVTAPDSFRITRDPRYGRSWLYADVASQSNQPLKIVTEFKVLRRAVKDMADESKAQPLTAAHRRAFALELRRDEKHMEVTPVLQKVADDLVGDEKNPVVQARAFFDYVIGKSDHYSKWDTAPKGKCLGDAMECMAGTGDCCTDQHALFIALCRARGIPCRLMFGSRLKPENEGIDHDPGYRCWPNFYAPGLGWVPLDVSSGDAAPYGRAGEWFGGLDENRMEWAEGREFDLEPRSDVRPDLVIRGWVEVNGQRHTNFVRTVNFQRQDLNGTKGTASAKP